MIQNSKEQHKDILCLISLSDVTRQQMKANGYNPDEAIKELKAIDNVDVGDITMQTISTIFRYKLVIIICHHVRKSNINALELSDNTLLSVDRFVNAVVNAVNNQYTGLIDLCICDSEIMAKSIKALSQYPDLYRIQYVNENEKTGVELRLCHIYPKLLKFSFDPIENYHIRYREAFLKANEKVKKEQKEEIEDVSSLPEGTNLGTMATGEQPFEVKRNSRFYIRVIFHDESEEEIKRDNIKDAWNIPYRIKKPILKELKDGDTVHLDLRFDTDNPEMTKFLHGGGEYSFLFIKDAENIGRYECFVEAGFREEIIHGTLKIKINDNPYYVDEWVFSIKVKRPENDLALDGNNNELPSNRLHNNNRSPFKFTAIPKYPVPHTSKEEVTDNRESDKYIQATRLPAKLYRVQAEYLFKSLKEKERFLGTDSTLDSWLHIMGCQMTQMWKPIRWINTKENLRILLNGIYEKEIDDKIYTKKFLSEKVELCFIDSKGNAMKLAKPKTEESTDKDIILQLISDLKKSDL